MEHVLGGSWSPMEDVCGGPWSSIDIFFVHRDRWRSFTGANTVPIQAHDALRKMVLGSRLIFATRPIDIFTKINASIHYYHWWALTFNLHVCLGDHVDISGSSHVIPHHMPQKRSVSHMPIIVVEAVVSYPAKTSS